MVSKLMNSCMCLADGGEFKKNYNMECADIVWHRHHMTQTAEIACNKVGELEITTNSDQSC